jgi:hypothetical protein
VGRHRGGETAQPWKKGDAAGRRLDPRQYPEFNAMFYGGDPAEFIKMRIESLSLMACSDEQLTPAYGSDRLILATRADDTEIPPVGAHFGPMEPPDIAARKRYIRMESVMIAHHASEALLRLFYAHVESEECPWLAMSTPTDFAAFKAKISTASQQGFDRALVAKVFLGGDSPVDAVIRLSQTEFDDAINALVLLLEDAGRRFIGDAFLYNAIKHGVTALAIDDDEAEIAFPGKSGQRNTIHKGPMHVYLHQKAFPNAPKSEPEWHYSADDANPARELSVAILISQAIDSLWAVARRRYMGVSGSIMYVPLAAVQRVIYLMTMVSMNKMARLTGELIKITPDGAVDAKQHRPISYDHIPEDWSLHDAATGPQPEPRSVVLPARDRDRQLYSTSKLSFFPFTPRGFQRG